MVIRFCLYTACLLVFLAQICLGATTIASKQFPEVIEGDLERQSHFSIDGSLGSYDIYVGGEVDGFMSRQPMGYSAFTEAYQPNRFLKLKNVGSSTVKNPLILINGRGQFRTYYDYYSSIVGNYTTPKDKAGQFLNIQKTIY
jgi:hypothetical protein